MEALIYGFPLCTVFPGESRLLHCSVSIGHIMELPDRSILQKIEPIQGDKLTFKMGRGNQKGILTSLLTQ